MADPAAIMRAASAQKPMGGMDMGGGMPESMEGPEVAHGGPQGSEGLDQMVATLQGVGEFLKAQGPKGQAAMGAFQALLQAMSQMGGQEQAPEQQPQEPQGSGRIHESQFPGAQVL